MKLARAKSAAILLTAAAALVSFAVTVFMFVPTYQEIARLSEDIVRAHSELEAQYLNRKHLLSSGEKAKSVRGTIGTLSSQFLPAGRELDFITSIEEIANRNGVEERIILSVGEGAKAAEELRVGFEITLNGASPGVLQSLIELERLPTLLIFESAVVRPGEGEPGEASYLSLNLRGFIVAPPAGL